MSDLSKVNISINMKRYIDRGAKTHEPQLSPRFQAPNQTVHKHAPSPLKNIL